MSEDSTKKNSLIRQLRDFGIGPIIGMGISMLTVPITTRMLAPEEYGKSSLFTLFQSLLLCVGILGLDQGYVRFYNTKEIDRNNHPVKNVSSRFERIHFQNNEKHAMARRVKTKY